MASVARVIYVLAIAFLAFLAGAWAMLTETFPSSYLHASYRGGVALWDQVTGYSSRYDNDFWKVERTPSRGVTVYDDGRADNGLTLYTSGDGPYALLIDMNGVVRHRWSLPYSKIWQPGAAVENPSPDDHMYWRKAQVFPNGDLLAIYVAAGDTPWGYGMVKLDKNSRVIWKYLGRTHHDFDVADDGRIYVLTHDVGVDQKDSFRYLKPPRIDDAVVVLSADGEELRKVDLLDAFLRSPHERRLAKVRLYTESTGDHLHTNAVRFIDANTAATFPFLSAGQVLVSVREIGVLAAVDLESGVVAWSIQGPWFNHHDPDLLPNGNILLFDNLGRIADTGGPTRLLEFDPQTFAIEWHYAGSAQHPFDSDMRGAQQRLDNGNTLITESSGGRIFEVTGDGDIVWEFINPVRAGPVEAVHPEKQNKVLIPVVSWASRVKADALDPSFSAVFSNTQSQKESL